VSAEIVVTIFFVIDKILPAECTTNEIKFIVAQIIRKIQINEIKIISIVLNSFKFKNCGITSKYFKGNVIKFMVYFNILNSQS